MQNKENLRPMRATLASLLMRFECISRMRAPFAFLLYSLLSAADGQESSRDMDRIGGGGGIGSLGPPLT